MRRWRGIIIGGVLWAAAGMLFRVIVAMSVSLSSLVGGGHCTRSSYIYFGPTG